VVFVGFLLDLEGEAFVVDVALGEHAGFYEDLFVGFGVEVYFHCVVALFAVFAFFVLSVLQAVVEFVLDVSVEFEGGFDFLGPEDPFRHFRQGFLAFLRLEVVIEGILSILIIEVFFSWLFAVGADVFVFLDDAVSFLHVLSSQDEFVVLFLFAFAELVCGGVVELFCGLGEGGGVCFGRVLLSGFYGEQFLLYFGFG
jgi:hypothetical protein